MLIFIMLSPGLWAQDNLGYLLASGVEDAQRFAADYTAPGVEGIIYNRSSGWYHTAEAKDFLKFEFSVIGNASVNLGEYQTFNLNTSDYQNLEFRDGAGQRRVASILGDDSAASEVLLNYSTSSGNQQALFQLPQGVSESGVDVIPTIFLQARLGIFKGTEIKARYFPSRDYGNVSIDLLGGAIKHEFTSWLPASNLFPVSIAGMVTYSAMEATYDFTNLDLIEGSNQRLESQLNFWMFSAIVSTNFPVLNAYGGIGYVNGTSETEMLGNFIVLNNSGESIVSLVDPLSVLHDFSGFKGNLGISLQLGLFAVHAEYNLQKYQTISAGLHIGI